jgi:uncharacterized protein (DUF1499 family)
MLVDFQTLERSGKPNDALAVPADWTRPDAELRAPSFDVPSDRLRAAVERVALSEPRTELTRRDEAAGQLEFVQRSKIFRFPDTITVAIYASGSDGSTLALYSRARVGYSDMGVNRARLQRWLDRLRAELTQGGRA